MATVEQLNQQLVVAVTEMGHLRRTLDQAIQRLDGAHGEIERLRSKLIAIESARSAEALAAKALAARDQQDEWKAMAERWLLRLGAIAGSGYAGVDLFFGG